MKSEHQAMPSKGRQMPAAGLTDRARHRLILLKVCFLAIFAVIVLRLIQIQAINAARFEEIARRMQQTRVALAAERGAVLDRRGTVLASNTMLVSYGADPKFVRGKVETVADRFGAVFRRPAGFYRSKILNESSRFVWLERWAPQESSRRIDAGSIHGIVERQEPRRLYHYDHMAAQLVGYTGDENTGLDGIELQFNEYLSGTEGYLIVDLDGRARRMQPSMDAPSADPIKGSTVGLTIDLQYQAIAEEELRRGVERQQAESGLVVMLDPMSGEVLAMANYPSVDPNRIRNANREWMKNRVITDMFEPGSVFKVVTMTAALEGKCVRLDEKFYAENGVYKVKHRPRPITDYHPHGTITFREAVEVSSNIVMAKVSDRIGAERMYSTARKYGFGTKTGIELPGESGGELQTPRYWSGTTLNSMAYGYEVSATPLQIAAAYGAIANRGRLMKPYVVSRVIDHEGQVVIEAHPEKVRDVVTPEMASQLTSILEGVVENGTGYPAKVDGLRIAGKTGTSRKYVNGGYEQGSYTASFAGFFPAEDPRVVCLVMLDKPRVGGYTGGMASAPIFKAIAQKVYAVSDRFQSRAGEESSMLAHVAVPDVRTLRVDDARAILEAHGFEIALRGAGSSVRGQTPSAGTLSPKGSAVTIVTSGGSGRPGYAVVPNVRGLSIRRALNSLALEGLDASVAGSGIVAAQTPAAGQQVKVRTRVVLRCEPRLPAVAGL